MINNNYQAAQSQERSYSKKLLRVRSLLTAIGIRCSINMFQNLMFSIQHPVDRFQVGVIVTEYNSQSLVIRAPLIGHSLLFENCNAQEFVNALVAAKLIPGPPPLFADVDNIVPPDIDWGIVDQHYPKYVTPRIDHLHVFKSEAHGSGHGDE